MARKRKPDGSGKVGLSDDTEAKRAKKPKRPASAYNCYLKSNYAQLLADAGGVARNVMKQAASSWKHLDAAGKAPYDKQAAEIRAHHEVATSGHAPSEAPASPAAAAPAALDQHVSPLASPTSFKGA